MKLFGFSESMMTESEWATRLGGSGGGACGDDDGLSFPVSGDGGGEGAFKLLALDLGIRGGCVEGVVFAFGLEGGSGGGGDERLVFSLSLEGGGGGGVGLVFSLRLEGGGGGGIDVLLWYLSGGGTMSCKQSS